MKKSVSQINAARRAHGAGNLPRTAALCRAILGREPENVEALQLLGLALAGAGSLAQSATCLAAAISIGGPKVDTCTALGRVLLEQHQFRQASACFRQALAASPLDWRLTFLLGRSLVGQGELGAARVAFEQVAALEPRFAEAWFNLGVLATFEHQFELAVECYRRAIGLYPSYVEALNNLAILLHGRGRHQEAAELYRRALGLAPARYDTRYNYGRLHEDAGRFREALGIYQAILGEKPGYTSALANASNCLLNLGYPRQAIDGYRRAIASEPDYVEAHWNLSLALLQTGQLREGWLEYAWRFRQWPALVRPFAQPLWDGSPLDGRRILLHSEQGLGDTIQFARYAIVPKDRGGHVILECQQTLVKLLSSAPGVDEVVERGATLPPFDCHCPLLSLPGIAGTEMDSIPADLPYLTADPYLVDDWGPRLQPDSGLKVGIAWAGNPKHSNDRRRSIPADSLSVFDALPDVNLYSLQTGEAGRGLRPSMNPIADGFRDFADTAAAMNHLDLIISVDTSVAHLAGALGRPVWTLLPYPADWRWLEDRTTSPWYPSMKLFRQSESQQTWDSVLVEVRSQLEKLPPAVA